ncbi:MAG: hypothetical protein ABSH26_10515, partial [Opitutaceae bacterium]
MTSPTCVCIRIKALSISLLLLAGTTTVGLAQTNWQTSVGDFTLAGNWSAGVPTSSVSAVVTNGTSGTPSVVNLSATGSLLDLTIGSFDTLNASPGGVLNVYGGLIQNDGAINFTGGSGANAILSLNASATLAGGGVLTMGYTGSGAGQAYLQQAVGGVTLTNENTIQGQGIIGNGGLTVSNASGATINANSSGATLLINGSGGVTNSGLLEATAGGTLNLQSVTVSNQTGNITAGNGSTVLLDNSGVIGGTLNNTGTGTLETVSNVTLDGSTLGALTINGTLLAGPGTQATVTGTIIDNGEVQMVGGGGANSVLFLTGNLTLQGTGPLTMSYSGSGAGQAYIEQGLGGLTLTNKTTIQGQGVLGNGALAVVNDGTINANVSGATLLLNASGGVTNSGLLEATGGGTLDVNSITVQNAGENITAGSGSTVDLTDATIVGGTLNNNSGGTLQVVGNTTLDASSHGAMTINGPLSAGPGTTITTAGTLVNNGAMQLVGGSGANMVVQLSGDTTLQGTGSVTLGYSGSGAGQVYIEQIEGGVTLTNNTTIQGQGVLGNGALTLLNDGTINSNVSGGTILLNASGGVTNSGLLEATGGGTLNISSITVQNAGENITAGSGSTVDLTDATIVGGTLNNNSGGTLQVVGNATFDASSHGAITINGPISAGPGTTITAAGALVNNGAMQLVGGSGANMLVQLSGDTTLQGTGSVTLGYSGSGAGQVYIEQIEGGVTLTNETTIQGQGVIGNGGIAVINGVGATIDANVTGATLT